MKTINVFSMWQLMHQIMKKNKRDPQRISKIKPFIKKYDSNGIKK